MKRQPGKYERWEKQAIAFIFVTLAAWVYFLCQIYRDAIS